MTTPPPCPTCGDTPTDHSAKDCLARVVAQRDEARRKLKLKEERESIIRILWRYRRQLRGR